jgi:hypothetical protein
MAADMATPVNDPMAREHKFARCAQFGTAYGELSCKSPQLQPIAKAFIRNMNRVKGIGIFPVTAVGIATINEAARLEAIINKKLALHDPKLNPKSPQFDMGVFLEVDKERQRLVAKWTQATDNNARFFELGGMGINRIVDWNADWALDAVQANYGGDAHRLVDSI